MFYADCGELVAELILREHACGPDCLCWKLRRIPAVEEALEKLGVPKFTEATSPKQEAVR